MAQFKQWFVSPARVQSKSQPRHLTRFDPAQQCRWTDCSAKAVSEYKNKVYCASHLLRTLQKQWQE
jgi:hypothetical protein